VYACEELNCHILRQRLLEDGVCVRINLLIAAMLKLFMKARRSDCSNWHVLGLHTQYEDRKSRYEDEGRSDSKP